MPNISNVLYFDLQPSLVKVQLKIIIFLFFVILSVWRMPLLWAVIVIIVGLLAVMLFQNKTAVTKIAYLQQGLWSLETKQGYIVQAKLQAIQSLGYLVFLQFYSSHNVSKYHLCITKDQLDFKQWQNLQKLLHFGKNLSL